MATVGPFNFSGGYSPGYGFLSMPPGGNYAGELRNGRFRNGHVTPRWSNPVLNDAQLGAAGKDVTGLAVWNDAPNSRTALIAVCDGKIFIGNITNYTPPTTVTMVDRTGAVTISNSDEQRFTFASLNNILIGCGGSTALFANVPFKVTAYTSNAANLGGSPPSGDSVIAVNNFLFIGRQLGSSTTYSRVNWSNVGDPETWTVGNFVDFNKSDGEPVMALGCIGTDLYIFKQTSIGRLSTYSQVISGAATLGPLQTVVRGIGCAGPCALDNLPNGNIVFLGYDGHLYEFDGSTTSDLSKRPFPGVNCYDSADPGYYGISIGQPSAKACVKTWKGLNEVWIGYDSDASGTFGTFAYDFENRIWQGHITDLTIKSFAVQPIAQYASLILEGSEILFHGNTNGYIFTHGSYNKQYPTDETGTATDFRVGTTLEIARGADDFVPRSLCFEVSTFEYTLIASMAVYVTYDTYFNGGSSVWSITSPSTYLPTRIFVNLPMRQDSVGSSNNVMPIRINLTFVATFTGTGGSEVFKIGNFFLSDEVIR